MRAACRAAGELASLFFGGCTVTAQQYSGSFGAGGAAQCSHRVARPRRPSPVCAAGRRCRGGAGPRGCRAAAVAGRRGGAAARAGGSFGGSGSRPRGREFWRIRTRWREIFAEIAVFPPSSSRITVSCRHPELQRREPHLPLGPPRAPSAARAGGSFGGSAPDGGRFSLRLQFSLLQRARVKAAGDGVRSTVLQSKASRSKASRSKAPGSTASPPRRSPG